ncbi:MAG: outer membrane insertion C- signal [Butyricicoccus sp.]|nr:outer membrane insertion C- signal [Butyricicoccus sp.]
MSVPVYLFTGFLDAGKTTFIQETLEDPGFNTGEKILVLLCEEGECEFAPEKYPGGNVSFLTLDGQEQLTEAFLKGLHRKYALDCVMIEYNGMWPMQALYDALPRDWEIYQIIMLADSTTFPSYLNNMRQLAVDKLQDPEMVIFNRCTDETDKAVLHRAVRMVNRRAQMAFERADGTVDEDDVVDELPFKLDAPVIELADEDYGVWYLDAMDDPGKYNGKTMRFRAYVCQTPRVPKGCLVLGRFGMTCCAADIAFCGVGCVAKNAAAFPHRSWVMVTAKVGVKKHAIYRDEKGPWLEAVSIEKAGPPQEELVYFLR